MRECVPWVIEEARRQAQRFSIEEQPVNNRVYALLDIAHGKAHEVADMLRNRPGVVLVDPLKGPPDLIMVIEASAREELVSLTLQALNSVESMTEGLRLLDCQLED